MLDQARQSAPLLGTIASWSAGLRYADIPAPVRESALRCIIDTMAVGIAGATRPLSRAVQRMVGQEVASGPATVFGTTEFKQPAGAALANAVAAHVLDFDDTCYDGIVHASCVILPAALACAEESDLPGEDFVAAFVAGSEVTYLLGRALTEIFWKGWWTTSLLGSIGATAAACRALRLDAGQTAHALAIAATFTFGLRSGLGTDAKPVGAGLAAEAAVRAALLARNGADGPLDALESSRGVAAIFNGGELDRERLRELGSYYALTQSGVSFKQFPACSGTQAATQAVQELMHNHSLAAGDIVSVTCRVTPLVATNLTYPNARTLTEAQFSLPFAVGCMLRFGKFGVAELSYQTLEDSSLRGEMSKVEMIRDENLVPAKDLERFPEAAEVSLHTRDGKVLKKFIAAAKGMPVDPLSDNMLARKFADCVEHADANTDAGALLAQIRNLAGLASVRGLLSQDGRRA